MSNLASSPTPVNTEDKPRNRESRERCLYWDELHDACLAAWRKGKYQTWACKDLEENYFHCIQYGWGAQDFK